MQSRQGSHLDIAHYQGPNTPNFTSKGFDESSNAFKWRFKISSFIMILVSNLSRYFNDLVHIDLPVVFHGQFSRLMVSNKYGTPDSREVSMTGLSNRLERVQSVPWRRWSRVSALEGFYRSGHGLRFSFSIYSSTIKGGIGGYFKDDRNFWAFSDPFPPPYCVQSLTVLIDHTHGDFGDLSPLPLCLKYAPLTNLVRF